MSVKLNASTSSGLVVDSDLTGSLKLQTGGNDALSIDSSQVVNFTKQFQFGGVLPPAFGAYSSGGFTMTGGAWTKIILGNEDFDTNNYFDSSTNYRFTPLIAGYYQFNGQVFQASSNTTRMVCALYKNGNQFKTGSDMTADVYASTVSSVIYLNGSTDYVELYCFMGSSVTCTGSGSITYLNGVLVRAA